MKTPSYRPSFPALMALAALLCAPTTAQTVVSVAPVVARDGVEPALTDAGGLVTAWGFQPVAYSDRQAWSFDGDRWVALGGVGPDVVSGFVLAFDPSADLLYLHGGQPSNGAGQGNETWVFDGAVWAQVPVATAPAARVGASFAHDAVGGGLVLFGGRLAGGALTDETWSFDGADWTLVATSTAPSPRAFATMAPIIAEGPLLFGGQLDTVVQSDETWRYAAGTWTNVTSGPAPTPRYRAALTFDVLRGIVVLMGGEENRNSTLFNQPIVEVVTQQDVWEYDLIGQAWSQDVVQGDVSARPGACAAYEFAGRQVIVRNLFDAGSRMVRPDLQGQNRVASLGRGCVGPFSFEEPTLSVVGSDRPVPGTTCTLRARALPASPAPALVVTGFSATAQAGVPLPAPLSAFGLPSPCSLRVSVDVLAAAPVVAGEVELPLTIPALNALLGVRAFVQVFAEDALSATFPGLPAIASTNALELELGS